MGHAPTRVVSVFRVFRGSPNPLIQQSILNQLGLDFLRVHAQVFDGLCDDFAAELASFSQREQRPYDRAFGVHFEEPAQPLARVAAAKAVGSQREEAARDPLRDLVGHGADVVRNCHECSLLFRQKIFDVGFF